MATTNMAENFEKDFTCMSMNIAKLTPVEKARLWHYRLGHPSATVPYNMTKQSMAKDIDCPVVLNEDCPICEHSKFKTKPFPRREPWMVDTDLQPWEKVYADGYGGLLSLGVTIGGANAGFIFADAKTNAWWKNLKSSDKQLPAILRKFFLWVEMQHRHCRVIVVDTASVNISAEMEEVAAEFDCEIRPISAGTPQELGRGEKAVQDLRRKTRALLDAAPHLSREKMWGLGDGYSTWLHYVLPGPNGAPSPYQLCEGRPPNLKQLFIKTWGCPVSFKPMKKSLDAPANKNANVTADGWFVGIQWPMLLILSKKLKKVVSVSRKKVVCYESVYILPPFMSSITKHLVSIEPEDNMDMPSFVRSIKAPRESQVELPNVGEVVSGNPEPNDMLTPQLEEFMEAQTEIMRKEKGEPSIGERLAARARQHRKPIPPVSVVQTDEEVMMDASPNMKYAKVGTRVKVPTWRFNDPNQKYDHDGVRVPRYSDGKPPFQTGSIVEAGEGKHKDCFQVDYDDDDGEPLWSHYKHLLSADDLTDPDNVIEGIIMAIPQLKTPKELELPRNVFECFIQPDWRDWLMAIKKEMNGWVVNQAFEEVDIKDIEANSRIVKLGEIYTRKRTGKAKHRAVVFGNLLRNMVDYYFTTSYNLSHDGFRLFAAISSVFALEIGGMDATCGYLQSNPLTRKSAYVYKPSYADMFQLNMEELADIREVLIKVFEKDGIKGIRAVARAHKVKDQGPKAWKLLKAVYGIPGSGLAFQNKVEKSMETDAAMTQSVVSPAFWYARKLYTEEQCKAENIPLENANHTAREFVIAVVSTDDFRYIGTPEMKKEFEAKLTKSMDMERLDKKGTADYLAVEMIQDLKKQTTECKQPQYWVNAAERFKDYFPNGMKARHTPLPEDITFDKATEEEIEEAKHLPYRQLVGVLQYPVAYTKPEMKFAVSYLSEYNCGWSKEMFALALRTLEYGHHTRERGIIYSPLDAHGINKLYAHGDSNFRPPLSRGGRFTFCNGAMISGTSAKHKKTNTSTAEAEAEEAFHTSTDVIALRNLMKEIGLEQLDPTVIYCDNQPAIHMMQNKGSMAKRTKAMDTQIYALRDRMIDHEVQLKYISTVNMAADIATKPLGRTKFEFFRDIITGYALVDARKP